MNLGRYILFILVGVFVFCIYGCNEVIYDQIAAESFSNGKLPSIMEQLLNPNYINKNKKSIDAVIDESKDKFKLKVAVIDNGTDIYHPQIIDKIAWQRNALNKVEFLGYDFMANDSNPSPELANFSLFAYGSSRIEDGKIVAPPENPLLVLAEHNISFHKYFFEKLKNHPILKDSIYAKKINAHNLTIFGAEVLIHYFDLDDYNESKKEGKLFNEAVKNYSTKEWLEKFHLSKSSVQTAYALIYRNFWNMSLSHGTPYDPNESPNGFSKFSMLYQLNDAELFNNLLKESLKNFPLAKDYEIAKSNYHKYIKYRSSVDDLKGEDSDEFDFKIINNLSKALIYHLYPPQKNSFLVDLVNKIEVSIVNEVFVINNKFPNNFSINSEMVNEIIKKVNEKFRSLVEFSIKNKSKYPELDYKDQRDLLKVKDNFQSLSKLRNDFFSKYDISNLMTKSLNGKILNYSNENLNGDIRSVFLRTNQDETFENNQTIKYLTKTENPFLESKAINSSHGTHTAGLIANNSPDVQIVPIRVITSNINYSVNRALKIKNEFKQQFMTWLKEPTVFNALANKFGSYVENHDFSWKNKSLKNREEISKKLISIWDPIINKKIDTFDPTFIFSDQLIQSIKYCGLNKIKIASISLAIESEIKRDTLKEIDTNYDIEDNFEFILMEYYKWKYAEAILKYAPHTLFVVALGNSNSWVDGFKRIALPVDLSSRFLTDLDSTEYLNKDEHMERIVPNNHINQILAVGSTDSKRGFSDFTNIIIRNKKLPQVFFVGENVNSSIKVFDDLGFKQLRSQYLSFIDRINVAGSNDNISNDFLSQNNLLKSVWTNKERNINRARDLLNQELEIDKSIYKPLLWDLFVNNNSGYGRMDGTSMATPGVARQISIWVSELAKEKGIKNDAILYNNPDFSPQNIIKMTLNKSIFEDEYYFIPQDPSWEVKPNKKERQLIDIFKGYIQKAKNKMK